MEMFDISEKAFREAHSAQEERREKREERESGREKREERRERNVLLKKIRVASTARLAMASTSQGGGGGACSLFAVSLYQKPKTTPAPAPAEEVKVVEQMKGLKVEQPEGDFSKEQGLEKYSKLFKKTAVKDIIQYGSNKVRTKKHTHSLVVVVGGGYEVE